MKNIIKVLLLAIFAIPSFGQSISIFDLDTTNFPTMKAKFYAFDKDGKPFTPSISDLKLSENGIPRKITNISCPPVKLNSISVGIMVDTYKYIDLARAGTQKLIEFLQMPNDELGITYMAKGVYIYQDFTKSKTKALDKAATTPSAPGVDINSMFNSPITGGMPFIKDRKNDKKVLILVSDLHCPNLNIDELKLIAEAKANGISIYSLLLGTNDYSGLFTRIANGTGGKVFERVASETQITDIFEEIEREEHYEPCEIEWEGGYSCDGGKTNVILKLEESTSISSYYPLSSYISELTVSPSTIVFGKRIPLTQNDTIIKLTAKNSDFIINKIILKYGSIDFYITNKTLPIYIPKNTSIDIGLSFVPKDSSLKYASFEIETDKCIAYFSTYGGFPGIKNTVSSLKLTNPNGGELFNVGSDTIITWTGISPTDTVNLEYSYDNGLSWKLLTKQATKLKYIWNKIPLPTSKQCLVKITQSRNNLENELTLSGHKNHIYSVAFSPDGRLVATCDRDGFAKLWDANTGIELKNFQGHNGYINSICFSPDGSRIATSSFDRTVKIWNINSGMEVLSLKGHTDAVRSVTYSSDGKLIATTSNDSTARIWDANNGSELKTLKGNDGMVLDIDFSPDVSRVAAAISDKTAKIWDINSGQLIMTLIGHTNVLWGICFSPDGYRIATTSWDETAKIWDAFTGLEIRTLKGHTWFVNDVKFSPNGNFIATSGSDKMTKIWDSNTGIEIKTIKGHSDVVNCISFSPDGNRIATASNDFYAKIWDIDFTPLQSDISDSLFSIIAPEPRFSNLNIDMGQVIVGDSKDTMVTDVLCNIGEAPLHILGVDVTNGDIANFMVPRGAGEFYLAPNECRAFMFAFMPTKLGLFTAKITVKSTIGDYVDTINIIGVGIAPQIEVVNKLIDFGNVDLGVSKDTIQAVTIRNSGNVPINITNVKIDTLNDVDFAMLSNFVPFTINPGDTVKMNLRFTPRFIGRTSGILLFEFNGIGSPAKVELMGNGLGGNVLLQVGKAEEYAGKNIDIPITLIGNNKFFASGIKYINLELQFNKTILYPTQPNNISVKNGLKYIKLDSVPIVNGELNQIIAKLNFNTALGSTDETPINVTDYELIGGDADLVVEHGNFKLLGVCYEGGERLLVGNKSKTMLLSISPNPATESIEIEYSNANEGEAEIIISNLLGQTILTQKLEKTQTGFTKLDLSQIPTGQYSILFKTETVLENKIIQIIK